MPFLPATLRLDLNVNRATFVAVARNDINLGHITNKRHGKRPALVQFGNNKILASTPDLSTYLLRVTLTLETFGRSTAAQRSALKPAGLSLGYGPKDDPASLQQPVVSAKPDS